MKKIILLLLTMFSICSCRQQVTDFGIVTEISLNKQKFVYGFETKYKVIVSKDFNAKWVKEVVLYTNELYTIGDTIVVTNKNNLKNTNYEQRN